VLHALRPDRDYFGLSQPGRVVVLDDGETRFEPAADGPHRYLTLTPEQVIRTTETLVQLSSQPPGPGPLDGGRGTHGR